MWAYVFFACGALSGVIGFWRAARSTAAGVPEAVFACAMLVIYAGGAVLTERRLPTMSLAAARGSVLLLAGIGLFLAGMLLNLR